MMRLIPQTIIGRTVLVLLLGLVVSHLIALTIYSGERYSTLAASRGRHVAEQIVSLSDMVEKTPAAQRHELVRSIHRPGMRAEWSPDTPVVAEEGTNWRTLLVRSSLLANLDNVSSESLRVAVVESEGVPEFGRGRGHGGMGMHRRMHDRPFAQVLQVSLRLNDGSWLNLMTPFERFGRFWSSRFFVSFLLVTGVVIVISIWAVRRSTAPLDLFARAAERLGLDINAPPLPEDGPREVRRASRAFNGMQERLRAFVRDRTHMLAAISHDLRTPITRLKLRAEFVEDEEQRNKMLTDLDEMEEMISATLSFAQDAAANEPRKPLDMSALLQTLCDDMADAGHPVELQSEGKLTYEGRPMALRRAFSNIIGNAVKYGGGARVGLGVEGGDIFVTVDDDGPGVPEEAQEEVFAPFRRLENSRSRETGGVGLGLASARSLIRAHGGDIRLSNRPGGGLRAAVTLPLES